MRKGKGKAAPSPTVLARAVEACKEELEARGGMMHRMALAPILSTRLYEEYTQGLALHALAELERQVSQ